MNIQIYLFCLLNGIKSIQIEYMNLCKGTATYNCLNKTKENWNHSEYGINFDLDETKEKTEELLSFHFVMCDFIGERNCLLHFNDWQVRVVGWSVGFVASTYVACSGCDKNRKKKIKNLWAYTINLCSHHSFCLFKNTLGEWEQ